MAVSAVHVSFYLAPHEDTELEFYETGTYCGCIELDYSQDSNPAESLPKNYAELRQALLGRLQTPSPRRVSSSYDQGLQLAFQALDDHDRALLPALQFHREDEVSSPSSSSSPSTALPFHEDHEILRPSQADLERFKRILPGRIVPFKAMHRVAVLPKDLSLRILQRARLLNAIFRKQGLEEDEVLFDRRFKLSIQTLSGETHRLMVRESTSIRALKAQLHARDGYPVDQMRLVFGGHYLDDSYTLGDYDIVEPETIHLVLKLKEQPRGSQSERSLRISRGSLTGEANSPQSSKCLSPSTPKNMAAKHAASFTYHSGVSTPTLLLSARPASQLVREGMAHTTPATGLGSPTTPVTVSAAKTQPMASPGAGTVTGPTVSTPPSHRARAIVPVVLNVN